MGELTLKAKILALIVIVLIAVGGGGVYQFRLFNRPPKADFEMRPNWINPTDETLIRFINRSTDPDNDPLGYTWLVDERQVNTSRDHWTRLPVGNHTVRLVVHDGKVSSSMEKSVSVDRSWVYPKRELKVPIKGITYETGIKWSDKWPSSSRMQLVKLTPDQIDRELEIIRDELGCNAIRITGDNNTELLKVTQMASNRFKEILISPRYIDADMGTTISKLCGLAKNVETLRRRSNSTIIFVIGNESTYETRGVMSDLPTFYERLDEFMQLSSEAYQKKKEQWDKTLNDFLKRGISELRRVYGGKVTYSAAPQEGINWNELGFDVIGLNEYLSYDWQTEEQYIERIKSSKSIGKPVYNTEWGSCTFKDALMYGGIGWKYGADKTYDQEAQADAIERQLEIFNTIGIDGCFLYSFIETKTDDATSYGIMKFEDPGSPRRKLGFYMYKSYIPDKSSNPTGESSFSAICIPALSPQSTHLIIPTVSVRTASHRKQATSW